MSTTPFDMPEPPVRDFAAHNAEVDALWRDFAENRHARVPVRLNTNPRVVMLDPAWNPRGVTYAECLEDPGRMADMMLAWQYYVRYLLPGDHPQGPPEAWPVWVHFDNIYDAAWFGCPVEFREDQVPATRPILGEDNKRMLFDAGIPEPFAGVWAQRALALLEQWEEKAAAGWTFHGRPVQPQRLAPFTGFDGPMTAAVSLRGAEAFCLDLLADPDYAQELLDFVTEALITRMRAWREALGAPQRQDGFGFGDDACLFISEPDYRRFVLPCHRRFYDAFATDRDRMSHLCGDAQRHFPTIHDELGVTWFDTGFPMDFPRFRKELGPNVVCSGGPRAALFTDEDPAPLLAETARILGSGILEGGRFVLQEGNNLPPRARLESCRRFYTHGKQNGGLRPATTGEPPCSG